MQREFTLLALIAVTLFSKGVFASNPSSVTPLTISKNWGFIENKGQLADENGKPLNDIKFYGHSFCNGQKGVNLYCRPGIISFVFSKLENNQNHVSEATGRPVSSLDGANGQALSKVSTCRVDMVLIGSNKNARIAATDEKPYFENFYTANTTEQGILNVNSYKTIIYKNIYPNIDMVLHACPNGSSGRAKEDGMKYEFVVYPGGNVSDIQIKWNGLDKIEKLKDSGIEYSFALGKMEESKPVSFQGENVIASAFTKNNGVIGFKVNGYDKSKDLVIDPSLTWGTYFGGAAGTNQEWCMATDVSGNVYISGSSASSTGIATSGAFQSTYSGGTDAFLAKFSSTGAILWSTYYGLKGTETAHSVATDHSGNVFITGATTSQASIATTGAYLTKNTAKEGFLIQFASNGARNWGTYFGGGAESSLDAATDTAGNVYILGETTSKSGIASTGAYQASIGGGDDLFLAKFSNNGSFQWSTYFGGSGTEVPGYLVTDITGNVFINASSTSTSGMATSGAYQTSFGGGALDGDVVLAKFNNSGSLIWSTYYGGPNDEQGTGIAIDSQSNLYITGNTGSSSNIATSGASQTVFGGVTDAFLAKFNENGALEWGTYFGGSDLDAGTFVATDQNNNVYMGGGTQSTSGIATTGSYQTALLNGASSFLSRFNSNGILEWATYYGSSDITTVTSVATASNNNVYMGCNTTSGSGIATSGAYQTSLAGTENGYLVKFNMNYNYDAGIASIQSPSSVICAGSDSVRVLLKNYGNDELDSVRILWSINNEAQKTYNWKGSLKYDSAAFVVIANLDFVAGIDTIRAWTASPDGVTDSMPYNDSAMFVANINISPAANVGENAQRCFGNAMDTIGAMAVNGDTYSWSSDPSGFSATTSSSIVDPNITTTYYLTETITSNGCAKTGSITITVNALPAANAGGNETICAGAQVSLGAAAVTGSSYSWTSSPIGFTSTLFNPTSTPSDTTTYLLTETNISGCSKTDSVIISVNQLPAANAGTNATICAGASISLGATAVSGSAYNWISIPAGFSSTNASPTVSPKDTTVYKLTETNVLGCAKTDSVIVNVNQLPVANTGTNATVCNGISALIGATNIAGDTYSWSSLPTGFSSTNSNPTVNPTIVTTYYLTESIMATGCSKEDSVIVMVNPLPADDAGKNATICSGSLVSIGASTVTGSTYSWTSSPIGFTSTSANPTVAPTASTIYILDETNLFGCSKADTVTITAKPLPDVHFTLNYVGDSANLKAIDSSFADSSYHWGLGDGGAATGHNIMHLYPKDTNYSVILTVNDTNGCTNMFDTTLMIMFSGIKANISGDYSLGLYPNPFHNSISVKYTVAKPEKIIIALYDMTGRPVTIVQDKFLPTGTYSMEINTEKYNLGSGVYMLRFTTEEGSVSRQVVKF